MRSASTVSGWLCVVICWRQKVTLTLLYIVIANPLTSYRGWGCWKPKEKFPMRCKHLALGFLAVFALIESSWARTFCNITSDASAPAVNTGATHIFTASWPSPVWSVGVPGSINSSTGVYSAPSTVWAQDVSRGRRFLPNDSVYKLPVNRLSADLRSPFWHQRAADNGACAGPREPRISTASKPVHHSIVSPGG
jgi:hypothetical protein